MIAFYDAFYPISEVVEDQTVVEGEILSCGDYRFEVIHTPGHHPGHISLYESQTKSLFVGDMAGLEVPFYNVRSGGVEGVISTVNKYNNLDVDLIIPSHGDLVNNPQEVIALTLTKLRKREDRLLSALSKEPTMLMALLPVLFRNEALYSFPGIGILRVHLEKLKSESTILKAAEGFRILNKQNKTTGGAV